MPTDCNPNYFWILTVEDYPKTNLFIAIRPLRTLNCFECFRSRYFVSKNIKRECCVFDIHRVKLAKNGKILIAD